MHFAWNLSLHKLHGFVDPLSAHEETIQLGLSSVLAPDETTTAFILYEH